MSLTSQPRGSCPGVWTPMESGDGLIVRVRPQWGRLQAARLRDIARLARETGNGTVELTRRANLQIRGVALSSWARLRDELVQLGLAALTAEAERRPALLVCPLSGLDAQSAALEPLAAELDEMIAGLTPARSLSHKFSVVLSGGSRLCGDVSADVHVRLDPARAGRDNGASRADGDGHADIILAGTAHAGVPLGRCREQDAAVVVRRCLRALAAMGHARMRELRSETERSELAAAAGEQLAPLRAVPAGWSRSLLGFQSGAPSWVGFGVPFGSADAEAWRAVAELSERFGDGEVRLTPSRQVLLTGVSPADACLALDELARAGFVIDERRTDVELAACSGAPACSSARGETRRMASELGELLRPLQRKLSVHVSGCEKSCARDGAADVTVVCGEDGARLGFQSDVARASAAAAVPLGELAAHVVRHFAVAAAPREWPRRAGTSA